MSRVSGWLISLTIFISFAIGVSYEMVGKTLPESTVNWYLPLELFMVMGFPALFGYLAGKDEKE